MPMLAGRSRRTFADERGVAMVTVLFVAAALTVVSSAGAYVTIQEFRSAGADQRGDQALGYAEAGIDRLMLLVRGGAWDRNDVIASGCDDPDATGDPEDDDDADVAFGTGANDDLVFVTGTVPGTNGTYRTEVRHKTCPTTMPSARNPVRVSIISTGEHPTARRVLEQVVELRPKGLPIALYASNNVSSGGVGNSPEVTNISLIAGGGLINRDRIAFVGNDPYYLKDDFYDNNDKTAIPAAAHAIGQIDCKNKTSCGDDMIEHLNTDAPLSCNANPNGTPGQSAWDGSMHGGPVATLCPGYTGGAPPTSRFDEAARKRTAPTPALEEEDIEAMIERAKTAGLYCTYSGNKGTCRVAGGAPFSAPSTFSSNFINSSGLPEHFVAYFDFPTSTNPDPKSSINTINWNADVSPLCNPGGAESSVIMLMPNGSLSVQAGGILSGAIFADKGRVDTAGGGTIHGTIIASEIHMQGGSNFVLDQCWLDNMPFAFLQVNPISWHQIDR